MLYKIALIGVILNIIFVITSNYKDIQMLKINCIIAWIAYSIGIIINM